jgi:lysozyme family protein
MRKVLDGEQMKESFDKAMSFIFSWEGGFTSDPNDNGNWTGGKINSGELKGTNFGISAASYPNEDIKNMTKERATEIYQQDYWNVMKCDDLPYPLDCVCMDTAVNMGIGRAQMFLDTTQDWKDYLLLRIARYADLGKNNPTFLRGWINRTIALWKTFK